MEKFRLITFLRGVLSAYLTRLKGRGVLERRLNRQDAKSAKYAKEFMISSRADLELATGPYAQRQLNLLPSSTNRKIPLAPLGALAVSEKRDSSTPPRRLAAAAVVCLAAYWDSL